MYCRLFLQVVECCHYFSQQTGVHERHPETALVTLLTGQQSCVPGGGTRDEASKGFSFLGVAKSAGDDNVLQPFYISASNIAGIV